MPAPVNGFSLPAATQTASTAPGSAPATQFGHSAYPPDAYTAITHQKSASGITERFATGAKYALQPKKLIKSAIFWHVLLALPVALSGGLTYPLIPTVMAITAGARFLRGFINPDKIAKKID
jgi:hypothetical protein